MINYENLQVQADLNELLALDIQWDKLKNKNVLITGATGMLASYIGFFLIYLNNKLNLNIKLVFLARNKKKLIDIYGNALENINCLEQDVCSSIEFHEDINYIIHAAGNASPFYIVNDPVGVIDANVQGTKNILEFARFANPENIVFTSTREVYGDCKDKKIITENDMGVIDPMISRSCYPESKRLAESMFMAYHKKHNIKFNILRIAHCYGPGMQVEGDGRVMADFLNDALNKQEIFLKSSGEAERAFCYITDAVSGIFRVLLQGENTNVYNLSNENEPIRIIDLAKLIQKISKNGKDVKIISEKDNSGYTNYHRTALCTEKIKKLGWREYVKLEDGLIRTLKSFE